MTCDFIDTVEYSDSLGALAQFAKKSKHFNLFCFAAVRPTLQMA